MEVLAVVFLIVLLAVMIVSVVSDMKRIKEMKSMTLELFEKRLAEIVASNNGSKLARFIKDNLVFMKKHETEVGEIFARVFSRPADSNTK